MIAPVGLLERQVTEALVEIALDGAQVHPELVRESLRIQPLSLVQLHQHLREPINQRVV